MTADRPPPVALRCESLACAYKDRAVLEALNISLQPGESVALLGANGSGKSLLIKTLSGELKPRSGTIWIDCIESGHATNAASLKPAQRARTFAVVPQDEPAPFAFLVRQVVTMGRLAHGSGLFDTAEDAEWASNAMKTASCEELADRPVTELSGGEKQRVLMARAIAQDCPFILLDEPTSHLDPSHQGEVARLIAQMAAQGKSCLTAVHDLNLAGILATRAILIHNRKIAMDAPVEAVLASPILDDAYQVSFERTRSASGRLIVLSA